MTRIQMLIVQVMMAVDATKQEDGTVPASFRIYEAENEFELNLIADNATVGTTVCRLESELTSIARMTDRDVIKALREIGNAQIREVNEQAHKKLVGYSE